MTQPVRIKKIIVYASIGCACLIGLIIYSFLYGEPIHDVNAWVLQISFNAKDISHPSNSILLEKKEYLGGQSLHGGHRCIYAVGETRSAELSKKEIKKAYSADTIWYWNKKIPLQIIFPDEFDGDYTMPYANWQDDLRNLSALYETEKDTTVFYIVFASVEKQIILFDYRCDD